MHETLLEISTDKAKRMKQPTAIEAIMIDLLFLRKSLCPGSTTSTISILSISTTSSTSACSDAKMVESSPTASTSCWAVGLSLAISWSSGTTNGPKNVKIIFFHGAGSLMMKWQLTETDRHWVGRNWTSSSGILTHFSWFHPWKFTDFFLWFTTLQSSATTSCTDTSHWTSWMIKRLWPDHNLSQN